jgi:hypothetical protein
MMIAREVVSDGTSGLAKLMGAVEAAASRDQGHGQMLVPSPRIKTFHHGNSTRIIARHAHHVLISFDYPGPSMLPIPQLSGMGGNLQISKTELFIDSEDPNGLADGDDTENGDDTEKRKVRYATIAPFLH